MGYEPDMRAAARRLWASAVKVEPEQRAVAAYLFGLAAECALKFVAASLPNGMMNEVQYTHFPLLRTALRNLGQGRRFQGLRRIVEHDSFMNQWEIAIRYARKQDVHDKPVETWKSHALDALTLMEGI